MGLAESGRYGEATRTLELLVRDPAADAHESVRIADVQALVRGRAGERRDALLREAVARIDADRPEEAVERLSDIVAWDVPDLTRESYESLWKAAHVRLEAVRKQSAEEARAGMDALRARYAAVRPPDQPDFRWTDAQDLVERARWADALPVLNELARTAKYRDAALRRRIQVHFALENYTGVCLDAHELAGSGEIDPGILSAVDMAAMRAPIDEVVVQLYEKALSLRPRQPYVWRSLVQLYGWRHDIDAMARVIDRAAASGVNLAPDATHHWRAAINRWKPGMRPDSPVYVDYAYAYEILTDTSPARAKEIVNKIAETAREYARAFPFFRNPNIRFRIVFFSRERDFQDYSRASRPPGGHDPLAYYSPSLKELVAYDRAIDLPTILRHETLHQILDCFAPQSPPWFHEGLASFFERSTPERAAFSPRHHAATQHELDTLPALTELLTMPYDVFQKNPRMGLLYCQSWSFIYFLHQQRRASLLDEYFRALMLGSPADSAYRHVFGRLDMQEMERAWRAAVRQNAYDPR